MKYLTILYFTVQSIALFGQITYVKTGDYYDNKYLKDSLHCYCRTNEIDSSYFHNKDSSGWIVLNALVTLNNLAAFGTTDNGQLTLDHNMRRKESPRPSKADLEHDLAIQKFAQQNCCLDTVFILLEDYSRKNYNYNPFKVILVKNPGKFPYSMPFVLPLENLQNLGKQYKRIVLCPHNINGELIAELNARLIDLGFLSKATRTKYLPEIRDALIEFQKANHLPWGYVDQQTLDNLDINLIISKY
jgi:hypothetical protein